MRPQVHRHAFRPLLTPFLLAASAALSPAWTQSEGFSPSVTETFTPDAPFPSTNAFSPATAPFLTRGAVYTSTNAASGNQIAIFTRETDGTLAFQQLVDTGGLGTSAGLGNQGALRLSQDHEFLLVVNAGSNEITVFRVLENGLELIEVEPTHGVTPVSLTQKDGLVFVLHAGSDDVHGLRFHPDGTLDFLPESRGLLSGIGTDPAQVDFGPDGRFLYVTERATNLIDRFFLFRDLPVQRVSIPSVGETPFGFAFGYRGQLFVSEAGNGSAGAGTVTSYRQGIAGLLSPLTTRSSTTQSGTCWVVATPDRRLIYASNTGSDSISSFRVAFDGSLALLEAVAATTGDGPLDMAVTPDGRFLYALAEAAGSVDDYRIEEDATLRPLPGTNGGLPANATGLAAR